MKSLTRSDDRGGENLHSLDEFICTVITKWEWIFKTLRLFLKKGMANLVNLRYKVCALKWCKKEVKNKILLKNLSIVWKSILIMWPLYYSSFQILWINSFVIGISGNLIHSFQIKNFSWIWKIAKTIFHFCKSEYQFQVFLWWWWEHFTKNRLPKSFTKDICLSTNTSVHFVVHVRRT